MGIWHRMYADFFMPSRLDVYLNLLKKALSLDYEIHSIRSFWYEVNEGKLCSNKSYLILRHDIDTDVDTAKAMWEIEQKLGICASYYFRLSTIDECLMKEIEYSGSEASYHYEEISTVAMEKGLSSMEHVYQEMSYIRNRFRDNLFSLRERTGLPMISVASHGDFVNRKLGIPNLELLKDSTFRQEMGIVLETYDEKMMCYITSRHSDTLYPEYWKPVNPNESLDKKHKVIYILTHPRHWRTNIKVNLIDNFYRMIEGIRYQLRTK